MLTILYKSIAYGIFVGLFCSWSAYYGNAKASSGEKSHSYEYTCCRPQAWCRSIRYCAKGSRRSCTRNYVRHLATACCRRRRFDYICGSRNPLQAQGMRSRFRQWWGEQIRGWWGHDLQLPSQAGTWGTSLTENKDLNVISILSHYSERAARFRKCIVIHFCC